MGLFYYLMPGSVLLSHGEAPHYHRRKAVSLPSSEWVSGGSRLPWPPGKSANNQVANRTLVTGRAKALECYMTKPHGQLVPVSSTHCCAYTPGLSTSWSWTTL